MRSPRQLVPLAAFALVAVGACVADDAPPATAPSGPEGDAAAPAPGVGADASFADAVSPDGGSTCPPGWVCPEVPLFGSKVGIWYWLNYEPGSWDDTIYRPVRGFYDNALPEVLGAHLTELRAAGVDFLLLDFTNGIAPDPNVSHIYKTGETLLALNADPRAPHMPFALAIGAQLWSARSEAGHKNEADFTLAHYAAPAGRANPDYVQVAGKPLVVVYNAFDAADAFLPDWTDARFHVGRANPVLSLGHDRVAALGNAWWGWAAELPNPTSPLVVTVSPGTDNTHREDCAGTIVQDRNGGRHLNCPTCDVACTFDPGNCPVITGRCSSPLDGDRTPGLTYTLEWLRALKNRPAYVMVASFNDFGDGTAIEPAVPRADRGNVTPWTDTYGELTPDWYMQITTGYTSLRTGLRPGGFYRDEDATTVYGVEGGALVPQGALPRRHPVILLPAKTIATLLARRPPQLPPSGSVVVAPGRPHAVVAGTGAVRFEVPETALRFGAARTLTTADYDALPYGGTIHRGAPVLAAPGYPPAFESDQGELWAFDCLDVVATNGSHVTEKASAPVYTSLGARGGMTCRR